MASWRQSFCQTCLDALTGMLTLGSEEWRIKWASSTSCTGTCSEHKKIICTLVSGFAKTFELFFPISEAMPTETAPLLQE